MKILMALLLGSAMGLTTGYLLWSKPEAVSQPAIPSRASDLSNPPATPLGEGQTPDQRGIEPVASLPYRESVAELVGGLEPIAKLTGTGFVKGRVVFESGAPAPGVLVRVSGQFSSGVSSGGRQRGDPPPPSDLVSRLLVRAKEEQERMSREWEGQTDADGRFEARGLGGEQFSCAAYLTGYEVGTRNQDSLQRLRSGVDLDLVARPVVWVPTEVVLASGEPVERASVRCTQGTSGRLESWSRTDSRLRFLAGSYEVQAELGAPTFLRSSVQTVNIAATSEVPTLRLVLEPRTGIRGRLSIAESLAIDRDLNCVLRPRLLAPGESLDKNKYPRGERDHWLNFKNDAEFQLFDLKPGRWALGLGPQTGPPWLIEEVEVPKDQIVEKDLVLRSLGSEGGLKVLISDSEGKRLSEANLTIEWRNSTGDQVATRVEQRLADGRFLVPTQRTHPTLREAQLWLVAESSQHGKAELLCPPPEQEELTITMEEPALLTVDIVGFGHRPQAMELGVELKRVRAMSNGPKGRNSRPDFEARVGITGIAEFKPTQPGRYEVQLVLTTKQWRKTALALSELALVSGKNATSLALPEVYTVIATTDEKSASQYCELVQLSDAPPGLEYQDGQSWNDKGEIRWEGVPAGDYVIRSLDNSGFVVMYLSVPTSGPVKFNPTAVGRLNIHWRQPTSALESLGLERGDSIVEIAEKAVADIPMPHRAMLMRLAEEKEIALVVERKGRRLSLIFDSAKLLAATMGGTLLLPGP